MSTQLTSTHEAQQGVFLGPNPHREISLNLGGDRVAHSSTFKGDEFDALTSFMRTGTYPSVNSNHKRFDYFSENF